MGQFDGEGSSLARLRRNRDVAAVGAGDVMGDGEPQAGAAARTRGVGAIEAVEDVW